MKSLNHRVLCTVLSTGAWQGETQILFLGFPNLDIQRYESNTAKFYLYWKNSLENTERSIYSKKMPRFSLIKVVR